MFVHYPIFEQNSQVSESTQPGLQSNNPQTGHFDLQVELEFSLVLLKIQHSSATLVNFCKLSEPPEKRNTMNV